MANRRGQPICRGRVRGINPASAAHGVDSSRGIVSGVFGQLQDALNTIWGVKPKPGGGVWSFVRARFLSFAMVGGVWALPKMAKAAHNEELFAGIEKHLNQTKEHADRLEKNPLKSQAVDARTGVQGDGRDYCRRCRDDRRRSGSGRSRTRG
jgi:uncharacterized protein DUF892